MKSLVVVLLAGFVLCASNASADRRKYVWTYQYGTIAADASELELYQATQLSSHTKWEYRIELEHGLTPNWDLSIYQIFAQEEEQGLKWDAFQIRTRYRLAETGRYPLDPLLYLEYNRKTDLKKPNKAEVKLILSRDFGRLNLAMNPVYEISWAPGKPQHEVGIDIGISSEISYRLSVGVESVTRMEFADGKTETGSYFGPTISLAGGDVYYSLGYVWGLTDESDNARVRFLLGVGL